MPPDPAQGFNDPRATIKPRVYAAALDGETCPACAALAGLEYAPGDTAIPEIPNPACAHPRGCRCSWL
jgi:hypothetical protein